MASCKAPSTGSSNTQVWYAFNNQVELGSCTIYPDRMVFLSPLNTGNEPRETVVFIEKRLDETHLLMRQDDSANPYAVLFLKQKDASTIAMNRLYTGESAEEVLSQFKKEGFPQWKELNNRILYSKAKVDRILKAPGLDELKREDLIASLQWRGALTEKLEQFLEATNNKRPFMVYRYVEMYRNQSLIELGYNPYKQVEYNLQKQFEGDEEILQLLNEKIEFE